MKKLLVLCLVLCVSVASFANTTEDEDGNKAKSTNKTLCYPENFSHWSIAIGGGANLMVGDLTVRTIPNFPNYLFRNTDWSVKAEFEYMVNPVWGLSLQYQYAPYNKKQIEEYAANYPELGLYSNHDLSMHEVTLNFVWSILNVGRRTRTHTNWNWYATFGLGVLCFERDARYDYTYRPAWMIPVSTSVEYTPIPVLGIFAEGSFRWYAEDRVNGVEDGQMKDCALYGGIGLRFHIGAKAKPHVRITDVNTYEPIGYASKSENSDTYKREIEALQLQVDDLNKKLDDAKSRPQTASQAQIDSAVNAATNAVRMDVKNLNIRVGNMENGNFNTKDEATVYFDFNSAVVTSDYQILIAKIAKRLRNNNSEKITIRGYCDHNGDVPYNKDLAMRRINAVKYILVNHYRIDTSRISYECIGKVEGENEIDLLNRRCDIIFK